MQNEASRKRSEVTFQRSGTSPSPDGFQNVGKGFCPDSGILLEVDLGRAGSLKNQRFALQAVQRSGEKSQKTKREKTW